MNFGQGIYTWLMTNIPVSYTHLDVYKRQEYECRKIKTLHELLISAEEYGGEADDSISLLLNDAPKNVKRCPMLKCCRCFQRNSA